MLTRLKRTIPEYWKLRRPNSRLMREPRTIDLSSRVWGCDYTYDPEPGGLRAKLSGWSTPRPDVGDYLILRGRALGMGSLNHPPNYPFATPSYHKTRYRVVQVEHCSDPSDMWFAGVEFAPRPIDGTTG